MPPVHSSPHFQMDNPPAIFSLLRRSTPGGSNQKRSSSTKSFGGGLFRVFKLFPMLTSGCKMVALLSRHHRKNPLLPDNATTATIFGYRRGRISLAIQEDPHSVPMFIIELPLLTGAFHKEMAADDVVRVALESETKTKTKKLMEEFVWAVYCNGRKVGYSIRRMQISEDELHVMQLLRGVSMGAGVLPCPTSEKETADGELTYIRARFERVIGSKDSEALYMINPDGAAGPELSIFLVRAH